MGHTFDKLYDSFNVGHWVALWPGLANEKHTTVVQSRRMGPCRGRGVGTGFPGSRLLSKVSKSEFPAVGTGMGCRAWEHANKHCNNCSTVRSSGFGTRAGTAVSTSNNRSNWSGGDGWAVTAATLSSSLPLSESLTIYVGNVWVGPDLLARRTYEFAWLSQTRHWSTMSRNGVSGGTLSKCRCNSKVLCPATNRSRMIRSRAVWPMSPKALITNVSNSVEKMDGSSPDVRVVRSNWRR